MYSQRVIKRSKKRLKCCEVGFMSRVIKFRAWFKEEGSMVGNEYLYVNDFIQKDSEHYVSCDEAHLMQFTGLSDKNGKEIYEGDLFITENYCKEDYYEDGILNSKEYYKENPTEEIIFHNSSWMYREVTSSNSILLLSDKIEDVEIIGNIHENPELLNA